MTKYVFASLILGFTSLSYAASKFDTLSEGMPKDVVAVMARIIDCNYWTDEMPLKSDKDVTEADKELFEKRRKEAQEKLDASKCVLIDKDKKQIKKKYIGNPKILHAIECSESMDPTDR